MKETRESGDILKMLKDLTTQHAIMANEIMRLKREMVGRPAVSARDSIMNDHDTNHNTNNISNTFNSADATNVKKRGRGRPRKDTETVSSMAMPYCGNSESSHDATRRINIDHDHAGGDGMVMIDINDVYLKTLQYVLEGGELFLHNPHNGRLFDIETRSFVGRYNLYLDRIDWV